jgi:hypothetical protein
MIREFRRLWHCDREGGGGFLEELSFRLLIRIWQVFLSVEQLQG